jgi:hypothetical protein
MLSALRALDYDGPQRHAAISVPKRGIEMLQALICAFAAATSAPAMPQRTALDPRAAVYELRIYYPAPGKLEALNARFRNHTMKLFEKHGMRNVAYWNELPTKDSAEGRVVYVLAYPSRDARDADWKAFGEDPAWRAVVAQSEAGGKLVAKVDSIFMTIADYSPPVALPGERGAAFGSSKAGKPAR